METCMFSFYSLEPLFIYSYRNVNIVKLVRKQKSLFVWVPRSNATKEDVSEHTTYPVPSITVFTLRRTSKVFVAATIREKILKILINQVHSTMFFIKKRKNKITFHIEVFIHELLKLPYVSGFYFTKWKLKGTSLRGLTPR